ncbi:6-pyruvoyl trahydropterin synthase family protein [Agarilytica rhodophyticola]|uniref:6-pyruvoyl trahydropterin synthase family protein n=1 Tax=Agarilytica rhodophyticola TaxID=1737490 RepID=UPI000B34898F|nr:6-carboxytetrahydropterin synthase [Agarilytica rhodophyticola]
MHLFVDNLTNVDFSFLHPTRGLVGETWLASVELFGELDEQGMVVDFGIVKALIRRWLDEEIDHRLLLPKASPSLLSLVDSEASYRLDWTYQGKHISCACPSQALTLIDDQVITTESVAKWCIDKLMPQFPNSVSELKLTFQPEHIESPYYHYSHGLKKHNGNCQRIAHGHRSRISILRNGEPSHADMQRWAQQWQDIYIGTQEDLVTGNIGDNHAFSYATSQGEFYLELPKSQCYLINTDTTVELIAQHIATTLKAENPDDTFIVKAYEGLAKGAQVKL